MGKYSFYASEIVYKTLKSRSEVLGRSLNAEARLLMRLGFDIYQTRYKEIPPFLRTGELVRKLTIYGRDDHLFDEVRAFAQQHEISPPHLFNAVIYLAIQISIESDREVMQRMVASDRATHATEQTETRGSLPE